MTSPPTSTASRACWRACRMSPAPRSRRGGRGLRARTRAAGSERTAAAQRALPRATRGRPPQHDGPGRAGRARTPCLPQHAVHRRRRRVLAARQLLRHRRGRSASRDGAVRRPHARAGLLALRRFPQHLRSRPAVRGDAVRRGCRRTRAARPHRRGRELGARACSRRAAVVAVAILLTLSFVATHIFTNVHGAALQNDLHLLFILFAAEALLRPPRAWPSSACCRDLQRYGWIKLVDLSRQILYTVAGVDRAAHRPGCRRLRRGDDLRDSTSRPLGYAVAARILCPELRISPRLVNRAALRPLAGFSGWVFISANHRRDLGADGHADPVGAGRHQRPRRLQHHRAPRVRSVVPALVHRGSRRPGGGEPPRAGLWCPPSRRS